MHDDSSRLPERRAERADARRSFNTHSCRDWVGSSLRTLGDDEQRLRLAEGQQGAIEAETLGAQVFGEDDDF